jgi:hypothetical protein
MHIENMRGQGSNSRPPDSDITLEGSTLPVQLYNPSDMEGARKSFIRFQHIKVTRFIRHAVFQPHVVTLGAGLLKPSIVLIYRTSRTGYDVLGSNTSDVTSAYIHQSTEYSKYSSCYYLKNNNKYSKDM